MKRFQKWRERKAMVLRELGLSEEHIEKVLDLWIEELEGRAHDTEWKSMGGSI